MHACFDFLGQNTGGGGGGGGRGAPTPTPCPGRGMGSPSPSPCHVPESYGQLCLSRQKLMHVLNEDTHFDLY